MVDAGYFLEVQLRGLADGLDIESRTIPRLGAVGVLCVCAHQVYSFARPRLGFHPLPKSL